MVTGHSRHDNFHSWNLSLYVDGFALELLLLCNESLKCDSERAWYSAEKNKEEALLQDHTEFLNKVSHLNGDYVMTATTAN